MQVWRASKFVAFCLIAVVAAQFRLFFFFRAKTRQSVQDLKSNVTAMNRSESGTKPILQEARCVVQPLLQL
jgi:hypothetical protein